jgi:hypothetical protein
MRRPTTHTAVGVGGDSQFFQKYVTDPFTEGLQDPILLFWSRRKSPTRQFLRFTNHLEKKLHSGVDGNGKRYRMGGSPRTKRRRA